MKSGKIKESMLKRSVLRYTGAEDETVLVRGNVGVDAAVVDMQGGYGAFAVNSVTAVDGPNQAKYAFYHVLNDIVSAGGVLKSVLVNIMCPEDFNEDELTYFMKTLKGLCEEYGVSVIGGHTEITDKVNKTVATVMGIGITNKTVRPGNIQAGDDIILTKWVGIEGARIIIEEKYEELSKRYTKGFIEDAYGSVNEMSVAPEAAIALENGASYIHNLSSGGILNGLWEMVSTVNLGMEVDFKKIPVKQEIIEICEFFDINPYQLMSNGSLLMTSKDGCDIVRVLENNGIRASVIGRITDGNDKILINDDEVRYLDTPKRDEIFKIKIK